MNVLSLDIHWIRLMMKSRNRFFLNDGVKGLSDIVAAMILCIVATCSFSACSGEEDSPYDVSYAKSRTVMVYMVAENSLASSVASDVAEMLKAIASPTFYPQDRMVLYLDDEKEPRIYVLDRNTTATSLAQLEPVMTYGEEVNSASAEQLGTFFDYVKENYSADSYGLVMWSHASGWIPSTYSGDHTVTVEGHRRGVLSPRKSFGVDNGRNDKSSRTSNVGHQMGIAEMAHVLELKGGIDFILFDACFMQCVEVAYELRHATQHIIASPAEIPGPGADYTQMVPAMFRKDDYATQMLQAYYKAYYNLSNWGIVIAEVNTSGLAEYATMMKPLIGKYREALLEADYSDVQDYYRYGPETIDYQTWGTDMPDFYDMQGVMRNVLSEEDFAMWQQKVEKVVTCMHSGYWFSGWSCGGGRTYPIADEQCCGVSMFVPLSKYDDSTQRFNETYYDFEWARDVWGD